MGMDVGTVHGLPTCDGRAWIHGTVENRDFCDEMEWKRGFQGSVRGSQDSMAQRRYDTFSSLELRRRERMSMKLGSVGWTLWIDLSGEYRAALVTQ